jgi:dihydrofolate reductase
VKNAGASDPIVRQFFVILRDERQCSTRLEHPVLDELQIHQIPVLFGGGRQLFEMLPSPIELEIVRVIDTPEATHIRYRVVK